ncbi:hypothetical protein [Sulfitobacter faviae]|uniref:hypothetical protein n=1 Tax=Sulfitobacter faviae TaxID=1775881 RepID=UPI00398D14A7
MDFNAKYNSRAAAEAGAPMQLLDPNYPHEPIMDGDKPCRVIVRGVASKSMQAKLRAKQKAAMMSKKAKGDDEEDEARVMEDVHMQLIEGAAPFVVGFENVERDGKPATVDDVEWFLDLTFPEMGVKEDKDGNTVTDKDGSPVFEMKNSPFAKQIGEFAGKQANFLGNAKSG